MSRWPYLRNSRVERAMLHLLGGPLSSQDLLRWKAIFVFAIVLCSSGSLQAQATYSYTGNNFTNSVNPQGNPGPVLPPYTNGDRVTLSIKLSALLLPNQEQVVHPLALHYSDGVDSYDSSSPLDLPIYVDLTTNSSGSIIYWQVEVAEYGLLPQLFICNQGNQTLLDQCGTSEVGDFVATRGSQSVVNASNTTPGTWSLASWVPSGCPINVIHYAGPPLSLDLWPTSMNADYTPITLPSEKNGVLTGLAAAEFACGVTGFNWQQLITNLPAPSGIFSNNLSLALSSGSIQLSNINPLDSSLQTPPPFYDPPAGGYSYNPVDTVNAYPFYWNTSQSAKHETSDTLSFYDHPSTNFSYKAFTTSLVGVLPSGLPTAPLFTWTWETTFNGTIGGVFPNQSTSPVIGSGTGGVTVTSINGVQLPSVVPPSQVSTTSSGLAYSRISQTFNGTVTIRNISGSAINGPLQIVFFGTPSTVTLVNATASLSGTPYLTVPAVASLGPGQSIIVSVQFKNPSNITISSTPVIYSGII